MTRSASRNHADSCFGMEKVFVHIRTLQVLTVRQSPVVRAHVTRPYSPACTLTGGY